MKRLIRKYISNDNEFSKRFTKSIRNFMFFHVAISIAACIVLPLLYIEAQSVVDVLTTMMPVYIAQQGANYVKSGYENGKKILLSSTTEEECENG